jgi:hypothetical protein
MSKLKVIAVFEENMKIDHGKKPWVFFGKKSVTRLSRPVVLQTGGSPWLETRTWC